MILQKIDKCSPLLSILFKILKFLTYFMFNQQYWGNVIVLTSTKTVILFSVNLVCFSIFDETLISKRKKSILGSIVTLIHEEYNSIIIFVFISNYFPNWVSRDVVLHMKLYESLIYCTIIVNVTTSSWHYKVLRPLSITGITSLACVAVNGKHVASRRFLVT